MAGLGGSSADGAAVLRALNTLFGKPFSHKELMNIGAEIGADVPFCIHGGFALCTGIGTEIKEILPIPECVFVIVKPDFECSTKEAYALYAKNPLPQTEFKFYYNVFELLYNNPKIEGLKSELINLGAENACLTGSGSAVYSVFKDLNEAKKAFNGLSYKQRFITLPVKAIPT